MYIGILVLYIIGILLATVLFYGKGVLEAFEDRHQQPSADFTGVSDDWSSVKNKSIHTLPIWTDVRVLSGDYWKGPIMPSEYVTTWPNGNLQGPTKNVPDYLYPGRGDLSFENPLYVMPLYKKM